MANTNKTTPTDVEIERFIASIEHEKRQQDAAHLLDRLGQLTGWPAVMWGSSIVGFGKYAYRYESGREGECQVVGFSPRKSSMSVYIMPGFAEMEDILARLGKHKTGACCLYINKLEDIDLEVFDEIVLRSIQIMQARYTVTSH